MNLILFFLFFTGYLLVRMIWFNNRKIRAVSSIERISLNYFEPGILLPEVRVTYKYYSQAGVYYGNGYLPVSSFLQSYAFLLYMNENGLPVLETESEMILTEEHIEQFLLSRYNSLIIFIDPVEPFHSKIDCINDYKGHNLNV